MTIHENNAIYNLTDTCVHPLTLAELLAMADMHAAEGMKLDYGVIPGDNALRRKIADLYVSAPIEQITTAHGCLEANALVLETLLKPGDRVITYAPSYQQFSDLPASLGCQVTVLPLYEEDGWQPHIDDLETAFGDPVRLVILSQPNNPTGTVFEPPYLQKLGELTERYHAWILADEVYRDPSIPSLSDQLPRCISTGSLSKMYSLAGLRLGWIRADQKVIAHINSRRDYTMISTGPLIDTLAAAALSHQEEILARSRSVIAANKKIVHEWLQQEPRVHVCMPAAGTVCFLKYDVKIPSAALAEQLLKDCGVFFVPGSCFGTEYHLRLGLTNEPEVTKKGLQEFSAWLSQNS